MGRELSSDEYDEIFGRSRRYRLSPERTPWYRLWQWVLEQAGDAPIIDFGCGPGHLAMMHQQQWDAPGAYLGIDFSSVAIEQARARVRGYTFEVGALPGAVAEAEIDPERTCVVFCEVLEHLEADLACLEAVPKGTRVVMTLPRYDDPGHVRWFPRLSVATRRYRRLLAFDHPPPAAVGRRHWGLAGRRI